jgi:hypothetical protein
MRFDEATESIKSVVLTTALRDKDTRGDLYSPRANRKEKKQEEGAALPSAGADAAAGDVAAKTAVAPLMVDAETARKAAAAAAKMAVALNKPHDELSDEESEDDDEEEVDTFKTLSVRVLSRMIVDLIVESAWNKSDLARNHNMSFSAFEAYVRKGHIDGIETKLRYVFCSTVLLLFYLSFLSSLSVCIYLSIYLFIYLSDTTTWHESNYHSLPPSIIDRSTQF